MHIKVELPIQIPSTNVVTAIKHMLFCLCLGKKVQK